MGDPTIVDFSTLDVATQDLIRKAVSTRDLAYCPYSNFSVGAALLCSDDTVFTGCNVENVAYGITVCAEQCSIVKAISAGNKQFKAIVVTAHSDTGYISPCGACRQFIAEFGSEIIIYLAKPDLSTVLISSIKELLPLTFTFYL
ncbi:hypothetical protein L9F63_007779, partial [Diploptera punctata]